LGKLLEIVDSDFSIKNKLSGLYLKSELHSKAKKRITIENRCEREDYRNLPSPDFSGLNLEDYLAPETVFLITNSRGCYHRKCSFCNISISFSNQFQQRSVEKIQQDLGSLKKKHGARFIFFADDGISVKRCLRISDFISGLDSPMYWQTMVRMEKSFTPPILRRLRQGGLRLLSFGMESGNQRILDQMRKGTKVEDNKRLAHDVFEAGVAVHINNIFGFPTETEDESQDTLDFLIENKSHVTSVYIEVFKMLEFAPVQLHPEEFGIVRVRRRKIDELIPAYFFSAESGMSRKEVKKFFKKVSSSLGRAYPAQKLFLDGAFSAHMFMYLGRFDELTLENIFPDRPLSGRMMDKRPRLLPEVISRRVSRKKTALYNPRTGALIFLTPSGASLASMMDGERTLNDIRRDLLAPAAGAKLPLDKVVSSLSATHELYRTGFIDLE